MCKLSNNNNGDRYPYITIVFCEILMKRKSNGSFPYSVCCFLQGDSDVKIAIKIVRFTLL